MKLVVLLLFLFIPIFAQSSNSIKYIPKTIVSIKGEDFYINGQPTYKGRYYKGMRIEGLLLNSRMIQGIFDDMNPKTVSRWEYPDTKKWDPQRNTDEFVKAMPLWRKNGLLAFTINMQGGSPEGYSKKQPWYNSAFKPDGSLRNSYMSRLQKIIDKADQLGMVVILGYFYFGQDMHLQNDKAVTYAATNATNWILDHGWRNVIIEVANECDVPYNQKLLKPENINKVIELVKNIKKKGRRLLVSTSYKGGSIPKTNVVHVADFLLMHGNGVKNPSRIKEMVKEVRDVKGYTPKPILFNEDDHFNFDKPENNFIEAVSMHVSWGFFDPGKSNYRDGYQCPPVNWGINTKLKKAFFNLVEKITGSK